MFLQQGTSIIINSINVVTNVNSLKTLSNISINSHSVETKTIQRTVKFTTSTPIIFEVENNEIIGRQNFQLATLPNVHLQDVIAPGQVPVTLINLLH